jgi:hypothetical protein
MSLATTQLTIGGGWVASVIERVESASPSGLNPGDSVEVWGSTTGTEANASDGLFVGTFSMNPTASAPNVSSPNPTLWAAYPFFCLRQVSGATPGGLLYVNGGRTVAGPPGPAGIAWNVRNVAFADSPVTAAANDWIRCDTTNGDISVTGPATANKTWGAIKISGDVHKANLAASAGNINGLAVQPVALQWGSMTLIGTGAGCDIQAST